MKGTLEFQDFRLSTSSPSALGRAIENPYKQFTASKIPQRKAAGFSAVVSYVDYTGKRHSVECRSKREFNAARQFFNIYREEHLGIRSLLSEYPRKGGNIPKKYHAEIKRELKARFNLVGPHAILVIEHGC